MHLMAVTWLRVGLVEKEGFEQYLPVKLGFQQARKLLVFLVGCHVSKTLEYKEHLE